MAVEFCASYKNQAQFFTPLLRHGANLDKLRKHLSRRRKDCDDFSVTDIVGPDFAM